MSENPVEALSEAFETLNDSNSRLKEELNLVQAQFAALRAEDRGWISLLGGSGFDDNTGISLDTLKLVSQELRESVSGSALPRRANDLRYSYTFGKPFIFPGVNQQADAPPKRGAKSEVQRFFDSPLNQRYAFNEEAQQAMNSATSTDGMYLFLGDDKTRTGRAIPVSEITGVFLNPEFSDEVWAYQRTYETTNFTGQVTSLVKWYFTDRFEGTRPASIGEEPEKIDVDRSKTVIDFIASPQVGYALGVPDLMAAQIWNRKYLTMIAHGEEVSAVLATYAAKVKVQSKKGADNVGVKTRGAGTGGAKTFAYGEGNAVDVFSSLGKTYDFDGLRPIAAMYAAAVGVSVVDLLASPAAAGSSYGSAQALQPGEKRSIESRREQWAAWYERVFRWGTGKDVKVSPAPLDETDPYRKAQIVALAWNTGAVWPDEIRPELLRIAGLTSKHSGAPENILLPNNSDSWERNDIDPSDDPNSVPSTAASPDQGVSNSTGGQDSGALNDQRSDTIGETLNAMQRDDFLREMRSIVDEMRALKEA